MGHSMITTEQQAEQQAEFEAAYAAWFGKETELGAGLDDGLNEVLGDGDIALLTEPFTEPLTEPLPAWA